MLLHRASFAISVMVVLGFVANFVGALSVRPTPLLLVCWIRAFGGGGDSGPLSCNFAGGIGNRLSRSLV